MAGSTDKKTGRTARSGTRKKSKATKKKTKIVVDSNNNDDEDMKQQQGEEGGKGDCNEPEESLLEVLSSHWLIRYVLPLYLAFAFAKFFPSAGEHWRHRALRDPSSINRWLPPFLRLRESVVDHGDERQLLIVGTMSSGTRQIVDTLNGVFGLEMGHEASDASSFYVRDGTVSWIFGIRYMEEPPLPSSNGGKNDIVAELCRRASYKVGFHPRMYRLACSTSEEWSDCWERECVDILRTEWGCALRREEGAGETTNNLGCRSFQPHRRKLLQTRDPLKVVQSIVAKFCVNDKNQQDFVRISALLFFQKRRDDNGNGSYFDDSLSCLEAVAYHVLEYNRAMLNALHSGLIDGMYKIEDATPCTVAQMAGLGDEDVVYAPNRGKFYEICRSSPSSTLSTNNSDIGYQKIKAKGRYKTNRGRVKYDWTDLEGGKHGSNRPLGDMELAKDMKELAKDLGYHY